jgi:DNA-binding NarL/FixJ family response regulator
MGNVPYPHCPSEPTESLAGKGNRVRTAIVDDDQHDCFLTELLLKRLGDFECVATYAAAQDALRGLPGINPALVLMDIRMPGMDGVEGTRRLKEALPHLLVVMTTGLLDSAHMDQAIQAGASGYLIKPLQPAQCLAVLKTILADRSVPRTERPCRAANGVPNPFQALTPQESQVMKGLEKGQPYKEIAGQMRVSYWTVNFHLQRIYRKLHVGNKVEAINKLRDWHPL